MRRPGSPWVIVSAAVAVLVVTAVGGYTARSWVDRDPATAPQPLSAVEIGFLQDMVGHHQQAVILGRTVDRDGIDPGVRSLARQIAESQQFELGLMTGWLRLAGAPPQNPTPMAWMPDSVMVAHHPAGQGHGDHGTGDHGTGDHDMGDHSTDMPGMATPEEIGRLAAASGREAEDLFLALMYRHHQGGIAMALAVEPMTVTPALRQTVRDMITTQSSESGLMGTMLEQRRAAVPPG